MERRMPSINFLDLIMRWLHILPAVLMVGGTAFMRFALLPALAGLAENERDAFRDRVIKHWKMVVHSSIGLLLLSGFYGYYTKFRDGSPIGAYHMLLGIKILIALVIMFIASALVGRSKGLEPLRAKAGTWLTINLLLAVVVILIAGYLKVSNMPAKKDVKKEVAACQGNVDSCAIASY